MQSYHSGRLHLALCAGLVFCAFRPVETAAQSVPLLGASMDTAQAVPAGASSRATPVAPVVQERSGGPFAVQSIGRPAPHAPRAVVVIRDTAAVGPAPAQTAAAQPVPAPPAATQPPVVARPPASTSRAAGAASARTTPAPSGATGSRPAASAATGSMRTHRVEWGETWLGVARQYSVTASALAAANPDVDPERLRSGTVLRIPRSAAGAAARRTHVVGTGDTLFGIARRYGVSPDAVRRANQLTDDVVRLGQTLVIPPEERR